MYYRIELNEDEMRRLNEGNVITTRFQNGSQVVIIGKKLKKDYNTYTDQVVEGLEAKYGRGNF